MNTPNTGNAKIGKYELEIAIDRPASDVWDSLTAEINAWWLPSFHMVGEGSVVSLQAEAGGQLLERRDDGASLLWYTVHMVEPGRALHLVGQSFPDWGGPATTMLKLALEDSPEGCRLVVSDALIGNVTDSTVESLRAGWQELFTDGLKKHCEAN